MTEAADRVLRDIELGSETEGDAVCVAFSLGGNINIDQLKDCFPSRYSHNSTENSRSGRHTALPRIPYL